MPRLPKNRGPQEPPPGPQPDYHPTVVDQFTDADGEPMVELADGNIEPAREWLPEDMSGIDTGSITIQTSDETVVLHVGEADEYVPPRPVLPHIDRKKKPLTVVQGTQNPLIFGYCSVYSSSHERCKGGVIAGNGMVILCQCPHHQDERKCIICKTDNDPEGWDADFRVCLDVEACAETLHQQAIEASQTPVARMIREVQTTARRSFTGDPAAPAAKPRRQPGEAKAPRTGRPCQCGCSLMTGGGLFRPGHDAKLKSVLKKAAAEGDAGAANELAARGWPGADPVVESQFPNDQAMADCITGRVAARYAEKETSE